MACWHPDRGFGGFDFAGRNRRPPRDPVNAMLSFGYAMLTKDATVATLAAGLEPYLGVFHRPRFGRPALALDLIEEFRPLIGDSAVITAVNNGEVRPDDFITRAGPTTLTAGGRKKMIASTSVAWTRSSLTRPSGTERATGAVSRSGEDSRGRLLRRSREVPTLDNQITPRRLRRVHAVAKTYGEALQYSVFVCDLTRLELVGLRSALLDEMKTTEDSVGIFDLGPPTGRGVDCVEFIGPRRSLPSGEAPVW